MSELDITDMGSDREEEVFKSLRDCLRYGEEKWWLGYTTCKVCSQNWLIAQDSRQNDVHFYKKIDDAAATKIRSENIWPEEFQTLERILELGAQHGRKVTFGESSLSSCVMYSARELILERPDISKTDIMKLLNLDSDTASKVIEGAKTA